MSNTRLYKYRVWLRLITFTVITALLCQNVASEARAGGGDCLAPQSRTETVLRFMEELDISRTMSNDQIDYEVKLNAAKRWEVLRQNYTDGIGSGSSIRYEKIKVPKRVRRGLGNRNDKVILNAINEIKKIVYPPLTEKQAQKMVSNMLFPDFRIRDYVPIFIRWQITNKWLLLSFILAAVNVYISPRLLYWTLFVIINVILIIFAHGYSFLKAKIKKTSFYNPFLKTMFFRDLTKDDNISDFDASHPCSRKELSIDSKNSILHESVHYIADRILRNKRDNILAGAYSLLHLLQKYPAIEQFKLFKEGSELIKNSNIYARIRDEFNPFPLSPKEENYDDSERLAGMAWQIGQESGSVEYAYMYLRLLLFGFDFLEAELAVRNEERYKEISKYGKNTIKIKEDLDNRPINARLLHAGYVAHDMAVKKAVNCDNKGKKAVYGGAGADVSNFLLSTNADSGYFIDTIYDFGAEDLENLGEYKKYLDLQYKEEKARIGFTRIKNIDTKEKMLGALAVELEGMGVDIGAIGVDVDRGCPRIKFMWKYKDGEEKEYCITFIKADITDSYHNYPDRLKEILDSGIDIYYQRAGQEIALGYDTYLERLYPFIEDIYDYMNEGGYFITDDYACSAIAILAVPDYSNGFVDYSSKFIDKRVNEITIPDISGIEEDILSLRVPIATSKTKSIHEDVDNPEVCYGWKVRVRKKQDVESPLSQKENASGGTDAEQVLMAERMVREKKPEIAGMVERIRAFGKGTGMDEAAISKGIEELFRSDIVPLTMSDRILLFALLVEAMNPGEKISSAQINSVKIIDLFFSDNYLETNKIYISKETFSKLWKSYEEAMTYGIGRIHLNIMTVIGKGLNRERVIVYDDPDKKEVLKDAEERFVRFLKSMCFPGIPPAYGWPWVSYFIPNAGNRFIDIAIKVMEEAGSGTLLYGLIMRHVLEMLRLDMKYVADCLFKLKYSGRDISNFIEREVGDRDEAVRLIFEESNIEKINSFFDIVTLLRTRYVYDMDKDDPRPPLQYAIVEGIITQIGPNLFITPVTESFRRHIIFGTTKPGPFVKGESEIKFKFEIMVPGERQGKRKVFAEERNRIARKIQDMFPDKDYCEVPFYKKKFPPGVYDFYEKKVEFRGDPQLYVIAFPYEEDGKRLEFVSQEMLNGLADRMGIDRKALDREIARQVAELVMATHAAGYAAPMLGGDRDVLITDLHTGNFRFIIGEGSRIKLKLVSDFDSYNELTDYEDPDREMKRDVMGIIEGVYDYIPGLKKLLTISADEIYEIFEEAKKWRDSLMKAGASPVSIFGRSGCVLHQPLGLDCQEAETSV